MSDRDTDINVVFPILSENLTSARGLFHLMQRPTHVFHEAKRYSQLVLSFNQALRVSRNPIIWRLYPLVISSLDKTVFWFVKSVLQIQYDFLI